MTIFIIILEYDPNELYHAKIEFLKNNELIVLRIIIYLIIIDWQIDLMDIIKNNKLIKDATNAMKIDLNEPNSQQNELVENQIIICIKINDI